MELPVQWLGQVGTEECSYGAPSKRIIMTLRARPRVWSNMGPGQKNAPV